MKFSIKKGKLSKAWYWRLVARETSRIAGHTFQMQYIRDVAAGQRDAPAIAFHLRLARDNVDAYLEKNKLKVVDARKSVNK